MPSKFKNLEAKSPSVSEVEMTEMILPQHTNALGTVFGGVVLSWVDIAAAICAQRHSNRLVVTASIDAMHFLAPIKLGWIVNIKASVNYASTTSCEIGVKIEAENPLTREYHHTASAYVTMVALDSNGRPSAMPPIKCESDIQKRRSKEAEERRKARLELKETLKERRKTHDHD
jgi:acyl-CoA hydrolase